MHMLMSDGLSRGMPWPKKKKRLTLLEHPNMKLMLSDLSYGQATIHDLADAVRLGKRQIYVYLREARAAGLVRIVAWERANGGHPVYGLQGAVALPDVLRPARLTPTEAKRRYRAKLRASQPNESAAQGAAGIASSDSPSRELPDSPVAADMVMVPRDAFEGFVRTLEKNIGKKDQRDLTPQRAIELARAMIAAAQTAQEKKDE